MPIPQTIRGPLLNPRHDGSVDFLPDAGLRSNAAGRIDFVGPFGSLPPNSPPPRQSRGIITPALFDNHIHIPQNPIRGHFMDGVEGHPPHGRLLAGLNRNVFPAEARVADGAVAERVVDDFARDTLRQGVIGGAAYMTVSTAATRLALRRLPPTWFVGLVLMNMNCPENLRTDESNLERDITSLAEEFGSRLIVTDRFAVSVTSPLRQRASALARQLKLRMQTHLNEQLPEKQFIEEELYPQAASYTDVYLRDGLLDRSPILAHCVRCRPEEFDLIRDHGAAIAHCPTSNTLLGSGIMPLDEVLSRRIPYALCTDVGASPTTSLLCEMALFLKIHAGRSAQATPSEALYRTTLAPAQMLGLARDFGSFEIGKVFSFLEIAAPALPASATADDAILAMLELTPADLRAYAAPPYRGATDHLAGTGLDLGPDLQLLEDDIRHTMDRLQNKVLHISLPLS